MRIMTKLLAGAAGFRGPCGCGSVGRRNITDNRSNPYSSTTI